MIYNRYTIELEDSSINVNLLLSLNPHHKLAGLSLKHYSHTPFWNMFPTEIGGVFTTVYATFLSFSWFLYSLSSMQCNRWLAHEYPIVQTVHMRGISKRTSDVRQKHQRELPFLHYLFWLYTGSIPLLSWSMRAVKQPSLPALHHVPVTSPVGSSQLLICCLELESGGLASVKPLSDKIQVLPALSPRFSTWTNGVFCFETHTDIQVYGFTNTHIQMQGKTCLNTHTYTRKYQHRHTDFVHRFLQAKHRRCMTCLQLDACCCVPQRILECVTDDLCIVACLWWLMAMGCKSVTHTTSGRWPCEKSYSGLQLILS